MPTDCQTLDTRHIGITRKTSFQDITCEVIRKYFQLKFSSIGSIHSVLLSYKTEFMGWKHVGESEAAESTLI